MKQIRLNNGIEMPQLGYGVFQIDPQECERCVTDAISVGYRSFDTAQVYRNEDGVGNAIRKSEIPREEFFITTKIWVSNFGYEKAKKSIQESLGKLQTDYIDLLLIHQPFGDYYGAYKAMEEAYKEGKIKAIGVSNFYADRYLDLVQFVDVKPAVNQVETHVFHQQYDLQEIMKKHDTKLMSWAPLVEGKNDFFNNAILKKIGEKYGKTIAQVALRYFLEKEVILIPKSEKKERMEENFDLFDFHLSIEDKEIIAKMDEKKPLIFDHRNPQAIEFLFDKYL